MKRVLTAVILIPIVVLALFKAPLWLFTLLVLGVALLAAREYLDIAAATGFRPFRGLSYAFVFCAFTVILWTGIQGDLQIPALAFALGSGFSAGAALALIASPFILLITALRREPLSQALPDASVSAFLLPYVALTLICLPLLRSYLNGALYLLYVMLLVWTGDIAALYVGRAVGKHKMAPRISPGKTWEGAIASAIGAVILGLLLFRYNGSIATGMIHLRLLNPARNPFTHELAASNFPAAPVWVVVSFAICINVAAQLGDLVESALKRGAGVKDSGTLLPGHGGVLDRIDALLFALPMAWLFFVGGLSRYFVAR